MPRFRRYRVFLVFAIFILVLLFQVSKNSRWEPAEASPYDSSPWTSGSNRKGQYEPPEEVKPKYTAEDDGDTGAEPQPKKAPLVNIPDLKTTDGVKGEYGLPTPTRVSSPAAAKAPGSDKASPAAESAQATEAVMPSIPQRLPGSVKDVFAAEGEGLIIQVPPGAWEGAANPAETPVHWQKVPEHFPVPEESLILLPTGKPKAIPAIQYRFAPEPEKVKEQREARLSEVKAEAAHAWAGYKKYAWTHDELKPVSKGFRDPFCGWAATLVDSLDTLWIMGMKDEFDDAVLAVKDLDFTSTPHRSDIPVFETVIRYLGGLLAAYDVSGGHSGSYRILLDKALELAEILMGAFDTPNRMPVLYYSWKPQFASQPQRASTSASIAELGSLSMEFTRLAQLTGKNKYYDAVARITDALEEFQNRGTAIPGLFPERIDASGCNRTATHLNSIAASSKAAKAQAETTDDLSEPQGYVPEVSKGDKAPKKGGDSKKKVEFDVIPGTQPGEPGTAELRSIGKRDVDATDVDEEPDTQPAVIQPPNAFGFATDWDCVPQGLTSGTFGVDSFSMGGSQDSTYEYFPKQYLLLGGLEPKYRTIHEKVVKAVKEHLLYRPMTKDDRNILFSGKAYARMGDRDKDITLDYEVTHLTCFLGGMFGLGGKIFNSAEDVEVAKMLADGCAWAYEVFPTGIMPEMATLMACEDANNCHWNRTLWWDRLDPNSKWRNTQMQDYWKRMAIYEEELATFKKEAAQRAQAEEQARRQEALRKESQQVDSREASSGANVATAGSAANKATADGTREKDAGLRKRAISVTGDGTEKADRDFRVEQKVKTLEAELDLNSVTAHPGHSSTSASQTMVEDNPQAPVEPVKPVSHEEYVTNRINKEHIPPGFVTLNDKRYILRPEAIESVWYMYRITGDPSWQEKGWRMFKSVIAATKTSVGHSAINDVTIDEPGASPTQVDNMESFWLAETLKYFYLLFSTPDVISLDEWVLNTEAHPFKRPT